MERFASQHADVMDSLGELHQDECFSDFTLQLKEGPQRFPRILLASMSPFFHKLVTVDMEESRSNEVNMEHVTQDTWNCITSFYFSSNNLVSIHNVQDVLVTSHMYGLEKLVQYCSEFLQSHCCAENCLNLLKIGTHFDLESLEQEARRVVAENFPTLCKSEDFLTLEKAELLELLEKEEVVTTEDDLCQALLEWIEKNNAGAKTNTEVFHQIRLNLVSDECLESLVHGHDVCIHSPSMQFLVTREKMKRMQLTSNRQTQMKARKRRPVSAKNSLLVLGVSRDRVILVFVWSFDERRWTQLPGPTLTGGEMFSCTALEDVVVVTGGIMNQNNYLLDLRTQIWCAGPNLLQGRFYPGMTTIGRTAYVVGGFGSVGTTLSSIEEYSKASGQWSATGCLQEATMGFGVAALGDTILVVGGIRKETERLIQTFNVCTRSAAVLNVSFQHAMNHVRAACHRTSAFFVGEEGDLLHIREVKGRLQVTSCKVLENFNPNNVWFGLHASSNCVRVVGSFLPGTVPCWDSMGKQITNDDIEDLPQQMARCFALEVDIPSR